MRTRLKNSSNNALGTTQSEDAKLVDQVRPLDEKKAIELGANFIGEFIIFSIAGVLLTLESWRSSRVEKNRKEDVENRLEALESQIKIMAAELEKRK